MRKMILWGMLLVGIIGGRASALPQVISQRDTPPQALTIEQLMATTSHEQLLRLATLKMAELGSALERVTDEQSARAAAPLAERCYLEMELIGIRIMMLTPPTDDERPRLVQLFDLFQQTRTRIERECARLSKSPQLSEPLRAVVEPIHGQATSTAEAR